MTKQWWKESVVYQIYPRSFNDSNGDGIGDIQGITSKLDYLKELGIDVVWLSPVYESPNDDNGYDISHYQKIMNEFGTMADWEEMLEEMHKRDIKLIMDLVVNHTSDEHPWFIESKKSKDNPYRDYYIWRSPQNGHEPNNWESVFSGPAWEYDEQTGEYYLHIFSKKQPDLNWEHQPLREEVYDMMKFWLDKGIDGFRMDVINFISKHPELPDGEQGPKDTFGDGSPYFMNGPRIHEFLHEMNQEVLSNYDVMTVGEMPGVTPEQAIDYTADHRDELNMVFTFEHMDLDSGSGGKWDLKPLQLTDLKDTLAHWQKALESQGWNSLYWNNHDQPRIVSRFGDDGAYRVESAKMLGTCLHMMKGTPYIYQGEEIGMTNVSFASIEDYKDIETLNMYKDKVEEQGQAVEEVMKSIHVKGRDNARTPMQWDASEHGGFTTGTPWLRVNPNYPEINAEAALNDPQSIFYYYQALISLRKQYDIIVYGSFDLIDRDHESLFNYVREYQGEKLLVLNNFTGEEQSYQVPEAFIGKEASLLISNYGHKNVVELGDGFLQPYEARVYKIG
ncbi:glycoside hydrolase family 13 protein [Pontibacillus marinus]|uniref:oligo-1,6-glucosidase n=1 Tax=Pontibacillus marinus BH030004 = DSM 16465 TaxID=1385511 RepID=A0A0A5FSQ0_9BACI|nr:alpha-glucosidase [Pontibacillus marinus]KGX83811.1 oligo-1,6-glucosidase [Pontibacillus marinus BH030004 = DSM 16465]